ncbi:efflux RND transporter periplasmic adaptor subunit [Acinetobacter sp. B10A]|uniref:HlyD family secretion protein n=1 Tax=Acinetobacter baretiae TaxID=2605383 RepID=UPI001B3C5DB5|nr:efflux RND transporter periplasmic adaptor subunit [Acinetobacter baretiae]MBF7684915.1 efflux RND transporter periplasmic adaptor subunit [Acinetobacter baretiae]
MSEQYNEKNTSTEHTLENQSQHAPKPSKNLRKTIIFIFILIIIPLLIGFGLWKSYQPEPVSIQGRVQAEVIHVSTKLISRIDEIYVSEGQIVNKEQPLIRLHSPEIDAKKQQALASLQSALALQATTNRGTREENLASLYANWQGLKAQQQLAHTTYGRGENLYKEGVISRQRRDEMYAAQQSSAQMTEAAYQQYKRAKDGSTTEQKSMADAQVEIAQAAVNEVKSLETETQLRSPIRGTISNIYGNPSELVATGVPVIDIIDTDHLWVSLNIREDQYANIYKKNSMEGYVPALRQNMMFKIKNIDPQGDFATIKTTRQTGGYDIRSFKLHLTPEDRNIPLKEGMSVIFKVQEAH